MFLLEFLSLKFILFLFVVIIVSYKCCNRYRNLWLLICSALFYLVSSPKYFGLLILLIVLTYSLGIAISRYKKKSVYVLSVLCIVSLLIFFKYTQALVDIVNKLILLGNGTKVIDFGLEIIMPLGISFITFQSISYLGDIYYSKIEVEKNFINVALYISYFPNIMSGPIQKAQHMLNEIKKPNIFNYDKAMHGLFLFIFGALQKFYVSDKLAPIANTMLATIENYSGFQYIFFIIIYALYIYSNFNSYSDMAIGISKLLGIELTQNFRRPYLSKTVKEFWQRWHISLSSWFIDYVYIPLGGNQKGKIRYYTNVIIIFLLSALWHGAELHFILWGLLNAIYQIIGDLTYKLRNRTYSKLHINTHSSVIDWFRRIIVFFLIAISWIFFAVPDIAVSFHIIKSMIFPSFSSLQGINDILILSRVNSAADIIEVCLPVIVFVAVQIIREKHSIIAWIRNRPKIIRNLIYVTAAVLLIFGYFSGYKGYGDRGFIYGKF